MIPLLRYELSEAIKVTLDDVSVFRAAYEQALGTWRIPLLNCAGHLPQATGSGAPPPAAVYEYVSYLEASVIFSLFRPTHADAVLIL